MNKSIFFFGMVVFLMLVSPPALLWGQPPTPTAQCVGGFDHNGKHYAKGRSYTYISGGKAYNCVACGDCTPAAGPSSAGGGMGGVPFGLPTTEGQAQALIVNFLLGSLMGGGSSADDQQQQALLQQQQAEAKMQAELLQKERAAQASDARTLWENQDAARSQELANLFGQPAENTGGISSLLQKQAALQLRVAAAPIPPGEDDDMRRRAGVGFDEAGQSLAAVPTVPEPEAPLDRGLVLARIDETKARIDKLDFKLENTRKKQEETRQKLEQARRELAAKQARPVPETPQDDAALLAALEAEEQNIAALSQELENNGAQLKELEDQRHKAEQDLEMWNGKL